MAFCVMIDYFRKALDNLFVSQEIIRLLRLIGGKIFE